MNPPVADIPVEQRENATTKRLLAAAKLFGDARMAVDRHEGPKAGPEFTAKVKAWHTANVALQRAARAYATSERSRHDRDAA